ncbi:unnamed protein product, partial [Discosporangium mesarthrocarpum]
MGRGFIKRKSFGRGGGGHHGKGRRDKAHHTQSSPRPPAFKARPPPPLPEELSSIPKYIKSLKFAGKKLGYCFKRDAVGVGYYVDHVQIGQMGPKARAKVAGAATSLGPVQPKSKAKSEVGTVGVDVVRNCSGKKKKRRSGGEETGEVKRDLSALPGKYSGRDKKQGSVKRQKEGEAAEEVSASAPKSAADACGGRGGRGSGDSEAESSEEDEGRGKENDDEDEDEDDEKGKGGDEVEGDEEENGDVGSENADCEMVSVDGDGTTTGRDIDESNHGEEDGDRQGEEGGGDEEEEEEEENNGYGLGGKDDDNSIDTNVQQSKGAKDPKLEDDDEAANGKCLASDEDVKVTFSSLGVTDVLCEAARDLGWTHATEIQRQSLPLAFRGKDVIGLAETGSGKTGAFAIPILQSLLEKPQRLYSLILAPTRELAFQINEVMVALGTGIGLKTVCIVGGIDMFQQATALALKPHVVIATPGRLVDHLENTKGFSLRTLKFLVLDEADRMLGMDFEEEINKILAVIPMERRTFLFSATMTSKVAKLQRASLKDPARVEVAHKFSTPKRLVQQYLFVPAKHKDCYLSYVLNEFAGQSTIVFVSTCNNAQRVALLLRNLGFQAVCLHGQMGQPKRLGALGKFKSGQQNVLIATDVASRGLDIP